MKYIIPEMKNSPGEINSKLDTAEGRYSELEDRSNRNYYKLKHRRLKYMDLFSDL